MNPRVWWTAAGLAVAVAMTLSACVPGQQSSPTPSGTAVTSPSDASDGLGESQVYGQTVEWERCGELDCGSIQVPLDWSDPNGDTITVALNRHPARDGSERLGSLLINPGGPGSSGLDYTEYFVSTAGDELLDHYDVVGFDPRGVGQSTPIDCGNGETLDDYYIEDSDLESEADIEAARQQIRDFAQHCRELSGSVIENVDTVSAVRDMDVIRDAVGDDALHYLGFSYGTQLGVSYAELYPDNVGRLVLDGAVDILLPPEELSQGQAEGFELALTNYLTWCVGQSGCPFDGSVNRARGQIADMLQTARTEGYPTVSTREVNGNLMVYGIVVTLYDQEAWPLLSMAFEEVVSSGTATFIYELANFYFDRNSATGEYQSNSTEAFTAIGCLDDGPGDPWSLEDLGEFERESTELSPTFGWWFASGLGCDGWPWQADQTIDSLDNAAQADGLLVVGTTSDPATPYRWSQSLAERINAPLLTYEGDGHTAYGRSNQCVIDVVDTFMVEGQLPDSGLRC